MSMQDQSETFGSYGTGAGSSGESSSGIQDTAVKAQQKAGEVIDQAQEKVGEVADKVKGQASSQISNQKDKAADSLGNVADAIRQTGDQLRQNEKVAPVAQYTDQLAQGVETVSNYLRSKSLGDIVGEVERFARREPALFLGATFTVGLLAGRFLRSSSSSSRSTSYGGQYQSSTNALARTPDLTGVDVYGSRSTGYSTSLPSDVVPGYSSYDLGDANDTLASTSSFAGGTEGYSELPDTDTSDYGLSSGSTGSSTYNSGFSTGGYSSNYPTDSFGSESGQGYRSQGRGSNQGSGGPIGGV